MQRLGHLTEVPRLLRQFQVRPSSVLKKVGLSRDVLADPEARIPYARVLSLLAECARATDCKHFGLLAGSQWRVEHLGLPGEIAASSATVGEAIRQFTAMHWLNTTGGVAFFERDRGTAGFGYAIFEQGTPEGTFHLYDLVIAVGVGMLRQLSGNADWNPAAVHLSHVRPADIAPYRRFFRARLYFDAEASIIRFPTSFENSPLPGADEIRRRVLHAKLSALGREDLLPRVYRMVRVALLYGLTSGDDVAAAMGLPRRTFNRRLGEHGTTFRHALETVRFEAARELLRDTALDVAQISAALGYSESSVFVRAFRRWSGFSPSSWRHEFQSARPNKGGASRRIA
jgi:AraC-like DNA-binding protein